MSNKNFKEIYNLISSGTKNISSRRRTSILRKKSIKSFSPESIIKQAFDTRRINQETEYNPRRGLQNYHRSEAFISEALSDKLQSLSKLKAVLDNLKSKFGRAPEWQDSYSRILLNSIDRALRTNEQDGDFSESQPGVGGLDYLSELLYVRYRLNLDNVSTMSNEQIEKVLLEKDENLTHAMVFSSHNSTPNKTSPVLQTQSQYIPENLNTTGVSKRDIMTKSYDTLLDKLFVEVRASKDAPEVERTITISVKDKLVG